jgi:hypothetical protein
VTAVADTVLDVRKRLLSQNLARVKEVAETIKRQRNELETLLGLPAAVSRFRLYVKNLVDAYDAGELEEARGVVDDKLRPTLGELDRRIREAQGAARDIKHHLDSLPMSSEFGRVLEGDLAQKAADQNAKLEVVDSWTDYAREVREIQRVFNEYVDFLGGWALRNAGFDEGACRLADELIRSVPLGGGLLPTLPAREAALDKTKARIIRLGFPEWSLWALPLAAHELGHIVLRPRDEPRTAAQVYEADAFATRVMGPAYACAEIYLRLDPLAEQWTSSTRAQVMLAMLAHMDGEAPDRGQPYEQIRRRLEADWAGAMRMSGINAPLLASDDDVQSWLAAVTDSIPKANSLGGDEWRTIEDWSTKIGDGRVNEIENDIRADVRTQEFRYVLNVAWHQRVMRGADLDGTRAVAEQLWDLVLERRRPGGPVREPRAPQPR